MRKVLGLAAAVMLGVTGLVMARGPVGPGPWWYQYQRAQQENSSQATPYWGPPCWRWAGGVPPCWQGVPPWAPKAPYENQEDASNE